MILALSCAVVLSAPDVSTAVLSQAKAGKVEVIKSRSKAKPVPVAPEGGAAKGDGCSGCAAKKAELDAQAKALDAREADVAAKATELAEKDAAAEEQKKKDDAARAKKAKAIEEHGRKVRSEFGNAADALAGE
ncbi:MAG: hypothetical protein HY906_07200 [Deltaproteobacteria bacterium]|nr:hypothetical protein [Deltaproteobacteria bacterium]